MLEKLKKGLRPKDHKETVESLFSGGGGGGAMFIELDSSDIPSVTFDEALAAIEAGKILYLKNYKDEYIPLTSVKSTLLKWEQISVSGDLALFYSAWTWNKDDANISWTSYSGGLNGNYES